MKRLSYLQSLKALNKIRENYCLGYQSLHELYGDSVLITFPLKLFVTRDNSLIEEILKDDLQKFGRSHLLLKSYGVVVKNGILAQEGEQWKKSRKGIFNTLNFSNLNEKRLIVRKHLEELIPKEAKQEFNFTEFAKTYAFRNINKLVFDNAFDKYQDRFKEIIDRSLTTLSKKQKNPLFYSRSQFKKVVHELDEIKQVVAKSFHNKEMPSLMHAHSHFPKEAIVGQVMNVLAAGYETTASTAIWCLYFMLKNKLSSGQVSSAINETLRLFPAVGVLLRKCHGDYSFSGGIIPDNAEVVCNLYSLHRHESYWDHPNEFNLARNFEGNSYFKPFGFGPTLCPGKTLALIELEELFNYLYDNFELSFSNEDMSSFINHRTDATIKPAYDLKIDLSPLTSS